MVEVGPDWSEGRLTAASQVGPLRKAGANPRGMQGYAVGAPVPPQAPLSAAGQADVRAALLAVGAVS
mgnify:CR=1 FL=1